MTRVFISGDRSAHPGMALPLVQQLLLQKLVQTSGNLVVLTGDFPGVSETVTFVCEQAGIPLEVVERVTNDWTEYAETVQKAAAQEVIFLHGQPESSNIFKGLAAVFDDNVLTLQSPELIFQPV